MERSNIKFRSWDNENKIFIFWGYNVLEGFPDTFVYPPVKPMPTMLFTGLVDKHKKEIYEGDVLLTFSGRRVLIEYTELSFQCRGADDYSSPFVQVMAQESEILRHLYN